MLLQGLGPTAAGYAIQGGLKYGLYELLKSALATAFTPLGGPMPLAPLLAAAAAAELIASTALCPYEAARIRLVADPSFASGLGAALSRLVRENGMAGVFGCATCFGAVALLLARTFALTLAPAARRSLPAIYLKQVPYTMAQLVTYDGVTRAVAARLAGAAADYDGFGAAPGGGAGSTVLVALAGASAAAVVASLASQPGDTLLSKLNQGRRAAAAHAGHAHARAARRSKPALGAAGIAVLPAAGAPQPPVVTSSDDEVELGALGAAAAAADADGGPGCTGDGDGDAFGPGPTVRAASSGGCGAMCALAARLGPAGLMLGWDARLAHTGTIVLVQLLIYDAVKAAVGLPVSAHGDGAAAAVQASARRLFGV